MSVILGLLSVGIGFGDSAWNMQLRCWIGTPTMYWKSISDLNFAIVRKFRENGVEIPFPQRDLHVRSSIPFPLGKSHEGEMNSEGNS